LFKRKKDMPVKFLYRTLNAYRPPKSCQRREVASSWKGKTKETGQRAGKNN